MPYIARDVTDARKSHTVFATLVSCLLGLSATTFAGDWPAYQHDNQRSGVTDETLKPPFGEAWRYRALEAPQPAWPDPAKVDCAKSTQPLRPRTAYDRVFHTVIADGCVYFGSSADDRIVALDTATGGERWNFFTEGPVRLAPAIYEGKVYAGSDDGYVYCLDAAAGALVWKYTPAADKRLIPGNGRLITPCPVRTGVVVKDGVVYVGVGLFPNEGVYLCALDAATGAEHWKQSPDPAEFIAQFSSARAARRFGFSPQGYLLASQQRLYVPTGRTSPVVVDLTTGQLEALIENPVGEGGTYALVSQDAVVSGPGTRLRFFDAAGRDQLASFPGRLIVVRGDISYLLFDDKVAALDRTKRGEVGTRRATLGARRRQLLRRVAALRKAEGKKEKQIQQAEKELKQVQGELKELDGAEYVWTAPCPESYAMIVTGDVVFTGTEDAVIAFDASNGERLWSGDVLGKAYGLAVADGRLFVSTDEGVIHCFEPGDGAPVTEAGPTRVAEPYSQDDLTDTYTAAAQYIAERTGITQGYCLDLGCGTGRLAFELARRSELKVVAVDDDPGNIAALRAALVKTGSYGTRVSALSMPLDTLPFTDYVANLIVSDQMLSSGQPPCAPEEIVRLLRPYGGTVCVKYSPDTSSNAKAWAKTIAELGCEVVEDDDGWLILRRGPLPGAGEWTHQYANPARTACTEDRLVGSPARLQWFGLPGPRPMADRHHRANPPLAKDGRLFVPGDNCVIAADAYNGTPLWQVEAPGSRRLASPRDAGHIAVTDDWLYAAVQEECWALDAATGRRVATFAVPQKIAGEKRNWGYVGSVDDLLFGSGQKVGATYTVMNVLGDYEIQWGDFKRMVTSDYLFCLDRHSGEERWVYQNGIIIHPTIAVADDRIYFVESHSKDTRKYREGRIALETLWAGGSFLVALDMRSGAKLWEKPVDFSLCQHIIYLSCAEDIVLAVGSGNHEGKAWYYLYAFDASTGAPLWKADHPNNKGGIGGDHGEQIHHPVIIGGIVYAEPVAYALKTGVRVNPAGAPAQWALNRREGCGTLSGSASCLFYRDGHPSIHDLGPDGARRKLNWITRLGCWINIIPAGGLILVPEASSGCSCPYPLQTSLAYIPSKP